MTPRRWMAPGLGTTSLLTFVVGCLPPGVSLESLFPPGTFLGPPCLTFLAGYEITGQVRDALTSEPLVDATITLRLNPPEPYWVRYGDRIVLTDANGRFRSSAGTGFVCDYPLEPIPLGESPDEIEMEIVTNEGVVTALVVVDTDQVTVLSDTHGRIDLDEVLVTTVP